VLHLHRFGVRGSGFGFRFRVGRSLKVRLRAHSQHAHAATLTSTHMDLSFEAHATHISIQRRLLRCWERAHLLIRDPEVSTARALQSSIHFPQCESPSAQEESREHACVEQRATNRVETVA
jgi:hypothetical protein